MSKITISLEDGPTGGPYVAVANEHEAEMTFSRAGTSRIITDHTGVPKALAGLGVGVALVKRVVEDARRDGIRIIPLCAFAKAQIERRKKWQDVLA